MGSSHPNNNSTGRDDSIFMKPLFRYSLGVFLLTLAIFGLRSGLPGWLNEYFVGADGWYMAQLVEENPFPLYYRSLLTILIHKAVYLVAHPLGLDGWQAISLSSSLAGAAAILALWRIRPDGWFLAINVLSGSFLVLLGHVENYAWVNAFLILSFARAQAWLERDAPLWPAMAYFMLAGLSHMLGLFYIPAYAYLLYRNRKYHPLEILIPVLAFTGVMISLALVFPMLGTDTGWERLVPLFQVWADNHHFTFFAKEHWIILLYFHSRAAFLGIPAELPLLFLLRKRIQTLYLKFLLGCVFCGLAWTTIWHPDWGRLDWDLFSQFGIPLHVLLGLLIRPPWPVCKASAS